jgi:hypothetical protein
MYRQFEIFAYGRQSLGFLIARSESAAVALASAKHPEILYFKAIPGPFVH